MDDKALYAEARAAALKGDAATAMRICHALLEASPYHFFALMLLGDLYAATGRLDQALAAYDAAAKYNPGQAVPFTHRAIVLFRSRFGSPPAVKPAAPATTSRLQMTNLGANGRFGNQLLQYAFLRLYAKTHGLSLEVPDWVGRDLFDFDDSFPSAQLTPVDEANADFFASLNRCSDTIYANCDLNGYFAGHSAKWSGWQAEFRVLYTPGRKIAGALNGAVERLGEAGNTLVALHLRFGDFGYGGFWVAPPEWYLDWLRALWPTLDRPVLYIATDEPGLVKAFAEFSPWDLRRIGIEMPGMEFFIDHHVMRHADHLAIANSSFSFTAAMLNARATSFMRPHPDERRLVPFEPWNAGIQLQPMRKDVLDEDEKKIVHGCFRQHQTVLHLGQFCSDWTNAVRGLNATICLTEAVAGSSVDALRRERKLDEIFHLIVQDADTLAAVLAGARESLHHARINALHLWLKPGHRARLDAPELSNNGYRIFRFIAGRLEPVEDSNAPPPGRYLIIQERFVPMFGGEPARELDIAQLCRAHGIAPSGVVHVGAHEGKEIATYEAMGVARILFIEANPAVYARLVAGMRGHPTAIPIHRAISDRSGTLALHLASFDQSSSLLPLRRHREVYPDIVPAGIVHVPASTLDDLLREHGFEDAAFQLLHIDVQGAEALVLKGANKFLQTVQAVSIEINFVEMYQGCAQIEEIDAMLESAGLKRVALASPFHPTWGDAFYVRK